MDRDALIELFSKIPGFAWSSSEDGQRMMGTTEGFVLDIWPGHVEAAALFPPDRADLAARNGTLFQVLLMAMRPDWQSAPSWLAQQMRRAARIGRLFEETNVTRRVVFTWTPRESRATLRVTR